MEQVISKIDIWRSKKADWGILLTILGIHTMAIVKVLINQNNSNLSVGVTIVSLFLLFDVRSARYYNIPSKYIAWVFLYSASTVILSLLYSLELTHSISEIPFGVVYQGCCFAQILLLWNCKTVDFDHLRRILFWYSGFLGVIAIILILKDPSLTRGTSFISGLSNQEGEMIITRASTGSIGAYVVFSSLSYLNTKNKIEQITKYLFLGIGILITLLTNRRTIVGAIAIVIALHLFDFISTRRTKSKISKRIVSALFGIVLFTIMLMISNNYYFDLIGKSLESLSNAIGSFLGVYNKYDMSANMRHVAMEKAVSEFLSAPLNQLIFGHGYGSLWIDVPIVQSFWELGILGGTVFTIIKIIVPFIIILKRTDEPLLLFLRYCLVMRLVEDFASGTCYGTFFTVVLYVFVKQSTSVSMQNAITN